MSDLDYLRGLGPEQARTYLTQFREQGEREAARQLGGAELDFSYESVVSVLDWLVGELAYEAVQPPAGEPRGILRRRPPTPPPDIRWDENTKLRMTLAAWYFGETFVRRGADRLFWDVGPAGIYFQLPVVRGFQKDNDLAPQWVVGNMMRRRVPEMGREDIPPIHDAVDGWRDQI